MDQCPVLGCDLQDKIKINLPNKLDRKRKWTEVLGLEIEEKRKICKGHFLPKDFENRNSNGRIEVKPGNCLFKII